METPDGKGGDIGGDATTMYYGANAEDSLPGKRLGTTAPGKSLSRAMA